MTFRAELPVVVIGAGPVGLAAAAHLATRELEFLVIEASTGASGHLRSTAHVPLFSPWKMNVDSAAMQLLEPLGWTPPNPEDKPTAGELCAQYLDPLARALAPRVRFDTRAVAISRRGYDKVKTIGREQAPFVVQTISDQGEDEIEARAVIDASGTWSKPNPIGVHGLPARGELANAARIRYGMPDVLGAERERYANKHVLVLGSGHSAAGCLISLAELAQHEPRTRISWALRSGNLQRIFGGGAKDGLPERGKLGLTLRKLTDAGVLRVLSAFQVEAVSADGGHLQVRGRSSDGAARMLERVDEIIVATGSRPDLSLARELRLKLDPWLESTEQLAPLIDPNVHSCGSVPAHGHRELAHPEPGYYAIGAKSYGRAPNFLMATGYEQARSVVAALAGDLAAADSVQLVLPETGVCSTDFIDPETTNASCGTPKGGCCAPAKPASTRNGCC